MNKIKTIIRKEWAEVFKNRMVLYIMIFMPLLFVVLPLVILGSMGGTDLGDSDAGIPEQFTKVCPPELNSGQCMQMFMVSSFMTMFLMLPMIIPVTISAYSIVGEKTTRSLEPLLATPITTVELLAGKSLAAAIPAVLATYVAYGIFLVGTYIITKSLVFVGALASLPWLIAIFLGGPLMAGIAINFSLIVSSRVNDPRAAEQLSAVVIVPVLALFFGQLSGIFVLDTFKAVLGVIILLLLYFILVYAAAQLFQRETILTRWK
jgi:ABC-2 type transport system permease protein